MEDPHRLTDQIEARVKTLPLEILRRYSESQEVVIFGSFAKGLQRFNSDLDIFCVGATKTHFKSKALEIMILPEYELYSELWLGSELANHIAAFGVALGRTPEWFSTARISSDAVEKKRRRVSAYLRSLQKSWPGLNPSLRQRYETKVRREVQRLSLLSRDLAVPPTKVLDIAFDQVGGMDKFLIDNLPAAEQDCIKKMFPRLFVGDDHFS